MPNAALPGSLRAFKSPVRILAVKTRERALFVHVSSVGSCSASSLTVQRSFFSNCSVHRPILELAHRATLHEKYLPRRRAIGHGECGDQRRDIGGVPYVKDRGVRGLDDVVRQSRRRFRHPSTGRGRNGVDAHTVATKFFGRNDRQSRNAGLRRTVVGLTNVAEESLTLTTY